MNKQCTRQNFIIFQDLSAGQVTSFTQTINITFTPNEMIVKSFSWIDSVSTSHACKINTNLIDTGDLLSFVVGDSTNNSTPCIIPLDLHFNITKQINSIYNFQFLKADGTVAPVRGLLCIHLEFIKY